MSDEGRTLLGRYRLIYRLGQGGMGTVWLAEDTLLERSVALKQFAYSSRGIERSEEMVARLMAEARAAARLRHPGLVTIHDVLLHDGDPWIVMEYVNGRDLGHVIADNGRLPWPRVAEIGAQVAQAVAAVHRGGIVHRDVKPNNILLTEEGRVVLVDFGVAKAIDAPRLTDSGLVIGTPEFIAPEMLNGQAASPATDMWALGVTLYMAVEGRAPFKGAEFSGLLAAILTRPPAPAEHAGPLRELLEALLSKDPNQRPDASAVQRALSSYHPVRPEGAESATTADGQGAVVPPVPPIPPKRPRAGASAAEPDEPHDDSFLDGVTTTVMDVTEFISGAVIVDPDVITTRAEFMQALQAVKHRADLSATEVATIIGVPVSVAHGMPDKAATQGFSWLLSVRTNLRRPAIAQLRTIRPTTF
ncbi:serine/threonine-protein kinase [Trebonia kvetii]|nr:serine/threonine-protein kinase [Trebonia kvetii]